MIYSLRGILIETDPTTAVIECGGVGYKCTVTVNTLQKLPAKGAEAFLYTHLNIRQEAVDLFGFATQEELTMFKLLTSVSGAGPKAAISLLSDFSPEKLALCLATNDAKTLTRAAGVGPKLAQRICLELKDKVGGAGKSAAFDAPVPLPTGGGAVAEAIAALISLGYAQSEAAAAIAKLDPALSAEQLVKEALKVLF